MYPSRFASHGIILFRFCGVENPMAGHSSTCSTPQPRVIFRSENNRPWRNAIHIKDFDELRGARTRIAEAIDAKPSSQHRQHAIGFHSDATIERQPRVTMAFGEASPVLSDHERRGYLAREFFFQIPRAIEKHLFWRRFGQNVTPHPIADAP